MTRLRRTRQSVLLVLIAILLGGCQLASSIRGGTKADPADHFEDPTTLEVAQAIADGKDDSVRELIAQGADLSATGKEGVTLLQWALFEARPRMFDLLLELGADPNQHGIGGSTIMHNAAIVDSTRYLETLLELGVDPDLRHERTQATPLMGATGMRTQEHFELLLEAGADVTLVDRTDNSALHRAAMVNAGPQVLALLEAGADPEGRNAQDATFQNYFWTTNANIMSEDGLEGRRLVAQWLEEQGYEVNPEARWTKD